jgi:CBS domain-containing protein
MPHKVEEVMTRDPVTLPGEAPVVKAAKLMRDRGIGDVLVVGDGRPVGVVALADLAPGLASGLTPDYAPA